MLPLDSSMRIFIEGIMKNFFIKLYDTIKLEKHLKKYI